MALGYVLGWVVPFAATSLLGLLAGVFSSMFGDSASPAIAPLMLLIFVGGPVAVWIALFVWAYRHGPRTGKGVLAAFLTMVGLLALLFAACFGIFALSGSSMH